MGNPESIAVLLIEDNPGDARLVRHLLGAAGSYRFRVEHAERLAQGLDRLAAGEVDAVLLDLSLPDSIGLATLGSVLARAPSVPIVVLTGLDDEELAIESVREGAQDYLLKGSVDSELIARSLRYAIERKRLEEERSLLLRQERLARAEAEAAWRRLRAIQDVSDAALAHLDLDGMLQQLLDRIRSALGSDTSTILLLDEAGTHLIPRASSGLEDEVALKAEIPVGRGAAGRILSRGEPVIFEDLSRVELLNPVLREKVRSLAGVPLLAGSRAIGVLHVGTVAPRQFAEDDVQLLQLVAERAVSGLERARLYEAQLRARKEAEQLASQLEAVISSLPSGLMVFDAAGAIIRMNSAADRLLGYTPEQLAMPPAERLKLLQIETDDGRPLEPDRIPAVRALRGETVVGEALTLTMPTGPSIWLTASGAPIRSPDGRILGAVLALADITALHELQEQREDFVRMVSHDLRNPLTSLRGNAQMLERSLARQGLAQETRAATAIVQSASRMNSMIRDLVESARLESGQFEINLQPVNLHLLTSEILGRVGSSEDQARLRLEGPEQLPLVEVDAERFERALVNLAVNALKYSPVDSSVLVRVESGEGEVSISVVDRGTGIPTGELPRVFEKYYRAKTSRPAEGLGLGLYIARLVVEAHGGRIGVESEMGVGSTFTIRLPVAN